MLELYQTGFPFDDDDKYILLDGDINNLQQLQDNNIQENSKIGLDIHLDSSELDKILVIPQHIKYLRFQCHELHYDNLILPDTLEYIKLDISLYSFIKNFKEKQIKLPKSLKSLTLIIDNPDASIRKSINEVIEHIYSTQKDIITNLEYLRINFHISEIHKFTNLKVLFLDGFQNTEWNEPLDTLPPYLEWLEIHSLQFNHPLNNLPAGLKVLIFGQNRIWNYYDGYQHPLDNISPSLEVLHFPECCSIEGSSYLAASSFENLPPSLKILRIPKIIPDETNFNCLPDSIETLEWYEFRKHYKQISKFPANLKKIIAYLDDDNTEFLEYIEKMQFPFIVKDFFEEYY